MILKFSYNYVVNIVMYWEPSYAYANSANNAWSGSYSSVWAMEASLFESLLCILATAATLHLIILHIGIVKIKLTSLELS